jgi:hypothetical protein
LHFLPTLFSSLFLHFLSVSITPIVHQVKFYVLDLFKNFIYVIFMSYLRNGIFENEGIDCVILLCLGFC